MAPGDRWHLDEVVATIIGEKHWLSPKGTSFGAWRAVDQHGGVPDVLVQSRRDRHAGRRLMRKLLSRHGRVPRVLITARFKSYAAASIS
ncbi:DDE-type integrase/transposase/recombinase [Paraburkholderia sp. UCT31]|uniref:DDE-type integrase/transposase/recombinase n=1 Tax=Paraburkholderia sp. UCT31 TaxID=2615209 RepID=UPI003975F4D0